MVHHTRDTDQKKRSPIPDDLASWDRWVTWRFGKKRASGKRAKEPVDPATGRSIDWKDPGRWLSFESALAAAGEHGLDGVGFVLDALDPFTVFDFDGCGDKGTGYVHTAVVDALDLLGNPYSEWSPSGKGIRAVVVATKPEGGCATKDAPWGDSFEMYDRSRFFTVTGDVFHPGGVPDAQKAVEGLYGRFLARPLPSSPRRLSEAGKAVSGQHAGLTKEEVEEKARNCPKTGARFAYLYDSGSAVPEGERSEADMFMCSRLAFWTGCDAEQMKQVFRASDLARGKYAGKGRHGEAYLDHTVSRAIEQCGEPYDPGYGDDLRAKVRDEVAVVGDLLDGSGATDRERRVMLKMLEIAGKVGSYRNGHVDFNANQTAIAEAVGSYQKQVSRDIQRLCKKGLLIRTSKGRAGKNSYYRLPKANVSTTYVAEEGVSTTYTHRVAIEPRVHVGSRQVETPPTDSVVGHGDKATVAGGGEKPLWARPRTPTGPEIVAGFADAEHHALGCGCDLCSVRTPSYATYADVTHLDAYRRVRRAVA